MKYTGKLYCKVGDHYIEMENSSEDVDKLVEAAKYLEHLHTCDEEGLQAGMPTSAMWFKATDDLRDALDKFR